MMSASQSYQITAGDILLSYYSYHVLSSKASHKKGMEIMDNNDEKQLYWHTKIKNIFLRLI